MGLNNFAGGSPNAGNQTGNSIPGGTQMPAHAMSNIDIEEILINYNSAFNPTPAMFRDEVIRETLGVLINKNKPNPLMIGPAGVGKTRIVEELARRIMLKDQTIPAAISDCVIYELPLSNLVAGTSFRGQLEEKIKAVIAFCEDPKNKVILFIDEIHQLCGYNESYTQIAQFLKPALSRGRIKCIGATTTQEAKELLKDPALNRRFARIIVDEFTQEQTIELLKLTKHDFITHHKNKIMLDDSLMADVVAMADEYRPAGSHRPDNALTLLDRAIGDAIVTKNLNLVQAQNTGNQAVIQALQSVPFVTLTQKQLRDTATRIMSGGMAQQELNVDTLREALSVLKGQDHIKEEVILNLRRRDLGIFPKKTPLSMLFAGSSGVGKTEMTKIIAQQLTGTKPIILNMTEFHSSASINRIIGAPAGYLGSDSNAELPFDCLESNPYQFILLDEFEKADPSVQRLFMSVLEEGVLKTNRGDSVDFSRCVIIATTNAGHLDNSRSLGFGTKAESTPNRKETADTLSRWFDRALLGRFTEIMTFHKLDKEVYKDIVSSGYEREVARIIAEKPRLQSKLLAQIPDDELDTIVQETYVPDFGARPAEKAIRGYIEKQLL